MTKARTCALIRAWTKASFPDARCAGTFAVPFRTSRLTAGSFFALPALNRVVGDQLHPMGRSLWQVDCELRQSCIVTGTQATQIIAERKARNEQVDTNWICALD